jgi:hypothetical protein
VPCGRWLRTTPCHHLGRQPARGGRLRLTFADADIAARRRRQLKPAPPAGDSGRNSDGPDRSAGASGSANRSRQKSQLSGQCFPQLLCSASNIFGNMIWAARQIIIANVLSSMIVYRQHGAGDINGHARIRRSFCPCRIKLRHNR